MKYLILFAFAIAFSQINAQDTLQVKEIEKTFSKGQHTGFSVNIPQAGMKDVISEWKKYLRDKNRSDYKEIKGEYILSRSVVPAISADSVTVYSVFSEASALINLTVFVTGNDSVFYNSTVDPSVSNRINTFIRNFAVNEYRSAVSDELSQEQKVLDKIEDDIKDLEKENDKLEKKIKNNERDIDKIESDIKLNLNDQELNTKAIYHQQQIIATFLEKSDLKSEEEKKLKELEKTRKKLQKANDSMHDEIDDLEKDNKSMKKKIDENEDQNIPAKKSDRDKQKLKIANVQVKLKNIQ